MRLVIASCSVDYVGRLTAHLPSATRLLLVKADGSVLVHSDGGSYKPLNWMSPPCFLATDVDDDGGEHGDEVHGDGHGGTVAAPTGPGGGVPGRIWTVLDAAVP